MHRRDMTTAVILIAVFAAAYAESMTFPDQVGVYPKLISTIGIILGLILALKSAFSMKRAPAAGDKRAFSIRTLLAVAATLFGTLTYIFLLQYLGYIIATVLFFIIFSYLFDSGSRLVLYPLIGIAVMAMIYAIFSMALRIPLPQGVLI